MAKVIRDRRNTPVQALMYKAGSRQTLSVTTSDDLIFQPVTQGTKRIYSVRASTRIAISAHNAAHFWSRDSEPVIDVAEEQLFVLSDAIGSPRDRITMRGINSAATVIICEVDDA